jgi:hypothetical protein
LTVEVLAQLGALITSSGALFTAAQ